MSKIPEPEASPCPCDEERAYATCCGPLHEGTAATTAEALMRSRYSAYVLGLGNYLMQTWHDDTRPESLNLPKDPAQVKWLGLKLIRVEDPVNDIAVVEFVARYRAGGGGAQRQHEVSRFAYRDGCWLYVDGVEGVEGAVQP